MADTRPRLGLLLPNQGVVFGATTPAELLDLAEAAESSGAFDAVFVGDNLLAKPRLESLVTLSAVAARTRRVRLGTACMASFPLRDPILLAAQWGALDNVSGGRTVLVACIGGGAAKAGVAGGFADEYRAFRIPPEERAARLEEGIDVLRTLWTADPASYDGRFHSFDNIAVRPRPVQRPCPPIWIANNPHVFGARPEVRRRTVERVARLADGWMTLQATPEQFRESWQAIRESAEAHGRDPENLESCLYIDLNLSDDTEAAFVEMKRFLDEYYSADFSREQIGRWGMYGPAEVCAERLRSFVAAGAGTLCLRFASYRQMPQLERFVAQVAPLL